MAYQETQRLGGQSAPLGRPARRGLAAVGQALAAAMKRIQYGQMVAALNQLSDQNLATIGIRRQEIAVHAHSLIYGTE